MHTCMPRALWCCHGGGLFFMSEVPLYRYLAINKRVLFNMHAFPPPPPPLYHASRHPESFRLSVFGEANICAGTCSPQDPTASSAKALRSPLRGRDTSGYQNAGHASRSIYPEAGPSFSRGGPVHIKARTYPTFLGQRRPVPRRAYPEASLPEARLSHKRSQATPTQRMRTATAKAPRRPPRTMAAGAGA